MLSEPRPGVRRGARNWLIVALALCLSSCFTYREVEVADLPALQGQNPEVRLKNGEYERINSGGWKRQVVLQMRDGERRVLEGDLAFRVIEISGTLLVEGSLVGRQQVPVRAIEQVMVRDLDKKQTTWFVVALVGSVAAVVGLAVGYVEVVTIDN